MGNNPSNNTMVNGINQKLPKSKIKDDSGELELEPTQASLASSRKLPFSRDENEDVIGEILRSSIKRDEGLGILAALPDECILNILSFLSLPEVGNASSLSKMFFILGRDDTLWKSFYRRGMRRSDNLDNIVNDAKGKAKRKERRGGKWQALCRLNYVRLGSEGLILTEELLGWSLEKIGELFGSCDEVVSVGRNGAYHYHHVLGLVVCFEDDSTF